MSAMAKKSPDGIYDGLSSTHRKIAIAARGSLHRHGVVYIGDVVDAVGATDARIWEALEVLEEMGLLPRGVRISSTGPIGDEPDRDPTPEEAAAVEAARLAISRAKRARHLLGLPTELSLAELDVILPPVDCHRTRARPG